MNDNLFESLEIKLLRDFSWEKWQNFRLALAVSGGGDSIALFRAFVELIQKLNRLNEDSSLAETFLKNFPFNETEHSLKTNDSKKGLNNVLKNENRNEYQNKLQKLKSDLNKDFVFHYSLDNILIVHINHQLRNIESDQDAHFVRTLAQKLKVSFIERKIEPEELQCETQILGSLEAAARNLRYRHLISAAEEFGARFLLTAHSLNDQMETMIQRFFRGTGIEGLSGIPQIRPLNDAIVLVRPLLNCSRTEIIEYLKLLDQDFRSDSSNRELCFTRNRIRLELIPLLETIFPDRWNISLQRFQQQSQEIVQQILKPNIESLEMSIESPPSHSDSLTINLALLSESSEYILQEFFKKCWKDQNWPLREMGYVQWKRLTQMTLQRSPTSSDFPGGIKAQIIQNRLLLERK